MIKDPGTDLRTQYVSILETAPITIGGVPVSVVDGKLNQDTVPNWDYYIVVTNQAAEMRTNKSRSATIVKVTLELHHITQAAVMKDAVESITTQVIERIFPFVDDPGLTPMGLNPPFELVFVKLESMETPPVVKIDGNRFLQRKILTFNNRITSN